MPGAFRLDISQQISVLGGREGELEAEGGARRTFANYSAEAFVVSHSF